MVFLLISFVAGILTVLAPCTLPLLPIIVGSSIDGDGKARGIGKALTIALSLGASVIVFTLLLKVSSLLIAIPQAVWTTVSGVIILFFGLIGLFPGIWEKIPLISRMSVSSNKMLGVGFERKGFWGNVIIGASLGPVFSTCSPTYFVILATVLPVSLFRGTLYLFVYALGLAGALLLIAFLGQKLIARLGGVSDTHGWFRRGLGILFVILGIAILTGFDKKLENSLLSANVFDVTKVEQKLLRLNDANRPVLAKAPEFVDPSGYLNTDGQPITIRQFEGKKVVLLDVWTYSCINCQRTIPYLNAWYEKYKDYGLEIIGLHTPEFAFEKVQSNVETAVKGFGIKYPVVLDNNYATWNAYGNEYWPRKYLIGADGSILYDHIGEGDYEKTEREIQKALMTLAVQNGTHAIIPSDIVTLSGVPSQSAVGSPEIYFGSNRNEYLANGNSGQTGSQTLAIPAVTEKNMLYLAGTWNFDKEFATSKTAGTVIFKYEAKQVYMVASSDLPDGTTVTVKKDGVVVKTLIVKANTLYSLINDKASGVHTLEIDTPAGLHAFTFTFG